MAAGMPLLPSALPPKGEASHYGANKFLNLIALLGYARDDDGAKRCQNSAALSMIMRRTAPAEPSEPVEPDPLFPKGQHAPWTNPEPANTH